MQKTEGKKTVIVIDEQGKNYNSTYPKRAKGLVKTGRARYVDENTILLLSCPPNTNHLEENKMNNNNNEKREFDVNYIITKIDEILEVNKQLANHPGLGNFGCNPGAENPIEPICITNNKLIDFLRDIYLSLLPKQPRIEDHIIEGYLNTLNKAIEIGGDDDFGEIVNTLTRAINELRK